MGQLLMCTSVKDCKQRRLLDVQRCMVRQLCMALVSSQGNAQACSQLQSEGSVYCQWCEPCMSIAAYARYRMLAIVHSYLLIRYLSHVLLWHLS